MDRYPVRVEGHRDERLSRWLWLVKWLLLIPHYFALAVLWVGLLVLTVVAYLAVLFTGRYPAAIRAYNTGVLRWSWRVGYYGYQALGTDRYPPFTLSDVPDYPARLRLDVDAPPPRRWLPLVAWLLALPHLIILGALTGASWSYQSGDTRTAVPLSVVGAAVLVAGLALLFTGRYPGGPARPAGRARPRAAGGGRLPDPAAGAVPAVPAGPGRPGAGSPAGHPRPSRAAGRCAGPVGGRVHHRPGRRGADPGARGRAGHRRRSAAGARRRA